MPRCDSTIRLDEHQDLPPASSVSHVHSQQLPGRPEGSGIGRSPATASVSIMGLAGPRCVTDRDDLFSPSFLAHYLLSVLSIAGRFFFHQMRSAFATDHPSSRIRLAANVLSAF